MSTIEHVESGLPVKTGDAHPLPVTGLSGSVIADNGVALPIDSLAHTFTSSGGLIATDTVISGQYIRPDADLYQRRFGLQLVNGRYKHG